MQSLLDGHPQIFGFNGRLIFHIFWESSISTRFDGDRSPEDIADQFIGYFIDRLKSRYDRQERKDELGEDRNRSIDLDTTIFRRYFVSLMQKRPLASRFVLISAYAAYALVLGEDVFKKRIFFHHVHGIQLLPPFIADFPGAKILSMTRDPRAAYVSGVENWWIYDVDSRHPFFPLYVLDRAINEWQLLARYAHTTDVMSIRLEDLGNEVVLRKLCHWLGVEFDECLLKSTWAGLRWWGDRLSQKEAKKEERGFSQTVSNSEWSHRLSYVDRVLLEYLLVRRLHHYRYPHVYRRGAFWAAFVVLATFLPTTYELRFLSPSFIIAALKRRQIRLLVSIPYHYGRRVLFFAKLFYRRRFGPNDFLDYIHA